MLLELFTAAFWMLSSCFLTAFSSQLLSSSAFGQLCGSALYRRRKNKSLTIHPTTCTSSGNKARFLLATKSKKPDNRRIPSEMRFFQQYLILLARTILWRISCRIVGVFQNWNKNSKRCKKRQVCFIEASTVCGELFDMWSSHTRETLLVGTHSPIPHAHDWLPVCQFQD